MMMKIVTTLCFSLIYSSMAQEHFSGNVERVKTYSLQEGLEELTKYASETDIRIHKVRSNAVQIVQGNLLGPLSNSDLQKIQKISYQKTKQKKEIEAEELFSKILDSSEDDLLVNSLFLWEQSIGIKGQSSNTSQFLESYVEKLIEEGRDDPSALLASYFVTEAVLQLFVNDSNVSQLYFLAAFPDETTDISDEGDLVELFELTPFSILIDIHSSHFRTGFFASMLDRTMEWKKFQEKNKKVSTGGQFSLMMRSSVSKDASLFNNLKMPISFSIISNGKAISSHELRPGSTHGFILNGASSSIRIQIQGGKTYDLKPYKNYHFKGN